MWKKVRFLFEKDDGSLPCIWLTGLTPEGLAAAYSHILSRATVSPDASFWHDTLDRQERLDAWPNVATLVASTEVSPFHFLAKRPRCGRMTIPHLGVMIGENGVNLDYRMGPEWQLRQVLAFFELLRQLTALDPQALVRPAPLLLPKVEQGLLAAWSEYCAWATPEVVSCLYGPLPAGEVVLDPSLREWNGGVVERVARAADENRVWPDGNPDPVHLRVLSDALEEAGCTDAALLGHLRSPGPHLRDCFALEAVLGC